MEELRRAWKLNGGVALRRAVGERQIATKPCDDTEASLDTEHCLSELRDGGREHPVKLP